MSDEPIRYARIEAIAGELVVVNVEIWLPGSEEIHDALVPSETANIGDTFVGGEFLPPPVTYIETTA